MVRAGPGGTVLVSAIDNERVRCSDAARFSSYVGDGPHFVIWENVTKT